MTVLVVLHSLIRWLVLAAGAVAIIRAAWGWFGTLRFARSDDLLGSAFTGLVDLNVLFGVVLLVLVWGTPDRPTLWHPLTMILAAVVAHGARMVGRRRGVRARHLFQGAGFLVSFGLILVGIQFVT
ncbi:MAG: hypothetical protein ACE5F6_22385 [Anaerolineae bacterium]